MNKKIPFRVNFVFALCVLAFCAFVAMTVGDYLDATTHTSKKNASKSTTSQPLSASAQNPPPSSLKNNTTTEPVKTPPNDLQKGVHVNASSLILPLALDSTPEQIAQRVQFEILQWRKLPSRFGDSWMSIGLDLQLINPTDQHLKDFLIECRFLAPSGSTLATYQEYLFETIDASSERQFLGKLRFGPLHYQVDRIECSLKKSHFIFSQNHLTDLQPVLPAEIKSIIQLQEILEKHYVAPPVLPPSNAKTGPHTNENVKVKK